MRAFKKANVSETAELNIDKVIAVFNLLGIPFKHSDQDRSSTRISQWIKATDELIRLDDDAYLTTLASRDPTSLTKHEVNMIRGHKAGRASGAVRKVHMKQISETDRINGWSQVKHCQPGDELTSRELLDNVKANCPTPIEKESRARARGILIASGFEKTQRRHSNGCKIFQVPDGGVHPPVQ